MVGAMQRICRVRPSSSAEADPFSRITGVLPGLDDVDMYALTITNPAAFSASTPIFASHRDSCGTNSPSHQKALGSYEQSGTMIFQDQPSRQDNEREAHQQHVP